MPQTIIASSSANKLHWHWEVCGSRRAKNGPDFLRACMNISIILKQVEGKRNVFVPTFSALVELAFTVLSPH